MDESKRVERHILVMLIGWQFYGIIYFYVNDEIKKSANIVHALN
jgi:hypothetical protein